MRKVMTFAIALLTLGAAAYAGCGGSHGAAKPSNTMKAQVESNIIETAVNTEGFSTLVAAVKAAGLVEALSGDGPFTVFAPTDDAFTALPEGTVEKLLEDKQQLAAVLTYHVAEGSLKAEDVVGMKSIATLNGQKATIKVSDGKAMIDNATIVTTDIVCSNGVIHVIDAVILPQDSEEVASLNK